VPALGHHLLLDERERHGDQDQAEQQVTAARDQLQLSVLSVGALERFARYQVAEPNRGQRNKAEVRAVDERPALPCGEHGRAQTNVTGQHEQHQGHRYARWCTVAPLVRPLAVGRGHCGRSSSRRRRSHFAVIVFRCGGSRRGVLSPVFVGTTTPPLLLTVAAQERHSTGRPVYSTVHLAAEHKTIVIIIKMYEETCI